MILIELYGNVLTIHYLERLGPEDIHQISNHLNGYSDMATSVTPFTWL